MKKIFFFIFFILFFSTSVIADWTFIASGGNGAIKIYIDKKTIRSNGNTVVWWQLDSYKEKIPGSDLTIFSNIAKTEGDCLRDGRKDLYIAYYDQKMGKGNKVLEDTNPSKEWVYNEPGEVYYNTLRFVCDNK
jgi:hypothetical protein